MSWWQIDVPTPERMLAALTQAFDAFAQDWLAAHPQHQGLLLCVAQDADGYSTARDDVTALFVHWNADVTPTPQNWARLAPSARCEVHPAMGEARFAWPDQLESFTHLIKAHCLHISCPGISSDSLYLPMLLRRRRGRAVEFVGRLLRPWLRPERIDVVEGEPATAPLFDAVYRHPSADEPRQVLADRLQAAGDPRGEFIALEVHAAPTPSMRTKAAHLLAEHRLAWMGPFAGVAWPFSSTFERGFLSTVTLGTPRRAALEALATAPEWANIEAVTLQGGPEDYDWPLIEPLRRVRRLNVPHSVLIRMSGTWQADALWTSRCSAEDFVGLDMPNLQHLAIADCRGSTIEPLVATPAWARLKSVHFVRQCSNTVLAQALRATTATVRHSPGPYLYLVERMANTAVIRVHFDQGNKSHALQALEALQAALPEWDCAFGQMLTANDFLRIDHDLADWTNAPASWLFEPKSVLPAICSISTNRQASQ